MEQLGYDKLSPEEAADKMIRKANRILKRLAR